MISHQHLIQLIIAYTLTGAFVFTVIITSLSLLGWVKFADKKQQKRLFNILIVEMIGIGLGFFSGFLTFNWSAVANDLVAQGKRLQTLEMKLEERNLSSEQETALSKSLKEFVDAGFATNYIVVASRMMDAESRNYGKQIEKILDDVHWPNGFTDLSTATFSGTTIFYNPPDIHSDLCEIVKESFKKAKIRFIEQSLEVRQTPIQQKNAIYVVIGTK